MDLQIRKESYDSGREIKASEHYSYITGGITLDGSKFTQDALILEGTALIKDNTTGKYEPYADAEEAAAVLTGASNAVPAACASLTDAAAVIVTVNGVAYRVEATVLKAITAETTLDQLVAILNAASIPDVIDNDGQVVGQLLTSKATVAKATSAIKITTIAKGSGNTVTVVYEGATADKTALASLFGIADAATASGTGSFPTTKSNPLVLDESVRFRSIDAVNPDVTVGQVINHSTGIYRGMCIGVTDAFATAVAGRILFI